MSEYENRIYDTLTATEEKFKSANEIANHMDRVKNKLIVDFWSKVEKELRILLVGEHADFTLEIDKNIFSGNSKCFLSFNYNRHAGFIYEHLANDLSFGLWMNRENIDTVRITDYKEQLRNGLLNISEGAWWLLNLKPNINFDNADSLALIIPSNLDEFSVQMANRLFDFAKEHKEHLKYIIDNCLIKR